MLDGTEPGRGSRDRNQCGPTYCTRRRSRVQRRCHADPRESFPSLQFVSHCPRPGPLGDEPQLPAPAYSGLAASHICGIAYLGEGALPILEGEVVGMRRLTSKIGKPSRLI